MNHIQETVRLVVEVLNAVGADFRNHPRLSLVLVGMLLLFCAFAMHLTHELIVSVLLAVSGTSGN